MQKLINCMHLGKVCGAGSAGVLRDFDISVEDVKGKLLKLRADKSGGPDELKPRLLLNILEEISEPLCLLFNRSLKEGVVPGDWKNANVCPIFKNGSRHLAANYRPVSLTSQICKVFESLMRDVIVRHLEDNELLKDSQHGFRRGRSCLTNLLTFLDRVSGCLDEGRPWTWYFWTLPRHSTKCHITDCRRSYRVTVLMVRSGGGSTSGCLGGSSGWE